MKTKVFKLTLTEGRKTIYKDDYRVTAFTMSEQAMRQEGFKQLGKRLKRAAKGKINIPMLTMEM